VHGVLAHRFLSIVAARRRLLAALAVCQSLTRSRSSSTLQSSQVGPGRDAVIAAPAATQADIGTTAILCHPLTSRRHRAPFCLPHRLIGVRHAAVGTTVTV